MKSAMGVAVVPSLPDLDEAQAMIDEHCRSDLSGCCWKCGEVEPCHYRELAHAAFLIAGQYPIRTMGIDRTPVETKFSAFGGS